MSSLNNLYIPSFVSDFYRNIGICIDMFADGKEGDKIESWMMLPFWVKRDSEGNHTIHKFSDLPDYAKKEIESAITAMPEFFDLPKPINNEQD